eukprot:jgi/Hompol1/1532/HPOL_001858-RA
MGTAESVRLLLEAGADPTLLDDKGRTPLIVGETSEFAKKWIGVWRPMVENAMNARMALILGDDEEDVVDNQIGSRSLVGSGDLGIEEYEGLDIEAALAAAKEASQALAMAQHDHSAPDAVRAIVSAPEHFILSNSPALIEQQAASHSNHSDPPTDQPTLTLNHHHRMRAVRCHDGHIVGSQAEAIVDNWLFEHGISHAFAPTVVLDGVTVAPSFFLNVVGLYLVFDHTYVDVYAWIANKRAARQR